MSEKTMEAPFGSFGFKVKIGDSDGGYGLFQEVSGLSVQINVTDVVSGGENNTTHKLLGNASFPDLTLKRGLCSKSLFDWINEVVNGQISRKTIRVTLLGADGTDKVTYECVRAVPTKWDGPSLNVMQDAIATETLTLSYEGLKRG